MYETPMPARQHARGEGNPKLNKLQVGCQFSLNWFPFVQCCSSLHGCAFAFASQCGR
jgi:hypothetical protein